MKNTGADDSGGNEEAVQNMHLMYAAGVWLLPAGNRSDGSETDI